MFFQCCLNYPCGFAGMLWEISTVECSVSSAVPELCREISNSSQIQRVCAEGFLGSLLYHLYDSDLENIASSTHCQKHFFCIFTASN